MYIYIYVCIALHIFSDLPLVLLTLSREHSHYHWYVKKIIFIVSLTCFSYCFFYDLLQLCNIVEQG